MQSESSGTEPDFEKLKRTNRKLRHAEFGQASERGALLDQLALSSPAQIWGEKQSMPRPRGKSLRKLRCRLSSAAGQPAAAAVAAETLCLPDMQARKMGEAS